MGKVRTCPKCGKIESQYTYFCTECGTKTIAGDGQVPSMADTTLVDSNEQKSTKQENKEYVSEESSIVEDSFETLEEDVASENVEKAIESTSSEKNTSENTIPTIIKSRKMLGIIIGGFVAIIAVTLVVFLVNNSSNDDVAEYDDYELEQVDSYVEENDSTYIEIPNWYYVNGVAVNGNELCFSRDDGLQMKNGEWPLTITHYVFYDDGSLCSMIEYIIFDNDWSASQYADELNSYDDEGKNYFGLENGDAQYYSVDNVLVEEFLPQYTQSNVGTMQDEISMFSEYGWDIDYVDEVIESSNDEEQNIEMFNDIGVHTYELIVSDVTWTEAYEQCLRMGGHLVRINSNEEYNVILNQINSEDKENIKFWVGGYRDENDDYRWVYNESYEDSFPLIFGNVNLNSDPLYKDYWLEGEPSLHDETTESDEYCMNMFYLKSQDRWVWNDVPNDILSVASFYSGAVGYICEYE